MHFVSQPDQSSTEYSLPTGNCMRRTFLVRERLLKERGLSEGAVGVGTWREQESEVVGRIGQPTARVAGQGRRL